MSKIKVQSHPFGGAVRLSKPYEINTTADLLVTSIRELPAVYETKKQEESKCQEKPCHSN